MRHRFVAAALLACAVFSAAPALAQPIQYGSGDGINNTPVTQATPLPVAPGAGASFAGPTPAAPVTGQYKVTASAAPIGSASLVNGIVIKARATNAGPVWIGAAGVTATDDGTGNGYKLLPGEAASFAVANVSAIYAIGTANDVLYFEGN